MLFEDDLVAIVQWIDRSKVIRIELHVDLDGVTMPPPPTVETDAVR